MLAFAIIAFILSGFAVIMPFFGVYMAMLSSVLALASFRAQPGLSGAAFLINMVNTAFLSPNIFIQTVVSEAEGTADTLPNLFGAIDAALFKYWLFVGFHVALFIVANAWRLKKGAPIADRGQIGTEKS